MKIKYVTLIVENMEESVSFYTNILGFKVDEVFNLPTGTITLLENGNETGFELIENPEFKTGFYSVGLDVEDVYKKIEDFKQGVKIAMEPTKISVGIMASVIDPNGVI